MTVVIANIILNMEMGYIWLESQSAPDSVSSCCITNNISLPIFIHRKIEDLGEMSPAWIETWSADENYHWNCIVVELWLFMMRMLMF